jgi:tetratricopeptide (TPR) repeat protein
MGRRAKKIRLPDEYRRSRQAKTPAGPRSGNRSTVLAVCGLLLLAVIAVFGQTAGHDFINFDDNVYVSENRHVLGGLTDAGIAWAFTESHVSSHWHPLTWLSLMADAQVLAAGKGPLDRARLAGGMHLVNLALHAANAVLLFLVLRAMTASTWPSALAAAVFAVHPLHVESVAWITERKDVLSGLFGLLALGAYAWYARGPSVVRYLVVAAALALGLMAKPVLVTWPLVFLLSDYWPLGRFSQRRVGGAGKSSSDDALREPAQNTDERFQGSDSVRNPAVSQRFAPRTLPMLIVEKIPLLLLVAASAIVTFLAQRSGGDVISLQSVPIWERIARAAALYVAYLGKSLWPVNLAALYPGGPMESFWLASAAGGLLALLTAGAVWGAWRGQRWLAVGWFWYLGTLLPTIGLIQVGSQVMADRFLYLPQIGLCVAGVWGAAHLAGLWPDRRWLSGLGGALLVAGLMACAWQQTSYWRNSETLLTRTLACTARNSMAHYNLGLDLASRGQVDDAIAHFQQALEIKPDFAGAHNNLGVALAGRGQVDAAMTHFRKALELEPDYAGAHYNLANLLAARGETDAAMTHFRKALEIKPDYAEAHNNFGLALADHGEADEAVAHYRKALEIKPDFVSAHYNLGAILADRGEADKAIAHYRKALEIKPDYAEAHYHLGLILAHHGEVEEAMVHYRKALEIEPDYAEAHNNFGKALADRGEVDEAIAHFRKSLELKPDNAQAHCNLALALSGQGSADEALAHYRQALDLAIAQNQKALADVIRARLRLPQPKINKK